MTIFIFSEIFFVTNLLTCVTNFVTRIPNFGIYIQNFGIKNILADRKKFQGERKIFQGEKKKYPADIFAQKGKEERKQKEVPFVHSVYVFVEINNIPLNDRGTYKINVFGRNFLKIWISIT